MVKKMQVNIDLQSWFPITIKTDDPDSRFMPTSIDAVKLMSAYIGGIISSAESMLDSGFYDEANVTFIRQAAREVLNTTPMTTPYMLMIDREILGFNDTPDCGHDEGDSVDVLKLILLKVTSLTGDVDVKLMSSIHSNAVRMLYNATKLADKLDTILYVSMPGCKAGKGTHIDQPIDRDAPSSDQSQSYVLH